MDSYYYTDKLATSFEVPTNEWERSGNKLYGWFVAPETTQYRFHIACDDLCNVYMGLNTSDPLNVTLLTARNSWTYRRYHMRLLGGDAISDWVNLTKDEKYYIEGSHFEGGGGDNYVVGVEINQTEMTDHHHAMKEIQYISIAPENPSFDTCRVTVTNPTDDGTYYLRFQDPEDLSYTLSEEIADKASASNFRRRVKSYFW